MLRFENEYMLYGLLLIPFFVILYFYIQFKQKKALNSYGEIRLLKSLMPDVSRGMKLVKFILLCLAYGCLVLAIANPQIGSKVEKGKRKGIDIMFCLDVSNSMLAQDLSPNRLEAAKSTLLSFVDRLKGDRIGLVVFAGKSFVQLPITSDYAAAKTFIMNVSTRSVSEQGTDIASALDKAAASMLPSMQGLQAKLSDKKTNQVIVVISDGEDHSDEALEMTRTIAQNGIKVYTIGLGSRMGEPIPERTSRGKVQYKKDKEGNTVITRLNEKILKDIALAGKGAYVYAAHANIGFDMLYKELEKIEKTELEEVVFSAYTNKYYIPLWIALILLLIEICLYNKKLIRMSHFSWLQLKRMGIFFIVLFAFQTLSAQTREELKHLRKGNSYYFQGEKLNKEASEMRQKGGEVNQQNSIEKQQQAQKMYENASTLYLKSNESNKDYYKSLFNLGASLYKQGKYKDAAENFDKVAQMNAISKKEKAKAYHNLGNSLLQQQKYKESIDAYKNALKANPADMDTKYNLEYAKRKMAAQMQQQQSQNQQKKPNQNQQDKNQQNQEQQNQNQQNKDQQPNDKSSNENQSSKDKQDQKEQQQNQQQKDAKRQLDALQQNERRTQEKVKEAEMRQTKPVKQEKDW
ncbi:MAG: VWA domain-containing protein [Bacteroidales bacterium]|jgi:Ca-activated chloride channel family protein|nr:VWA domain-containing protein [Bacteroidales bacterium]